MNCSMCIFKDRCEWSGVDDICPEFEMTNEAMRDEREECEALKEESNGND